MKQHE